MAIDGTPKFTTLAVAEITADLKGSSVSISCKAAFVDRNTGATHGWTKGEGAVWSEETKRLLLELRDQMEQDLATLHFHGHSTSAAQPASPIQLGGIGEHLQDADQA